MLAWLATGWKDWLLRADTSLPPSRTMWSLRKPYLSKIHLSRAFSRFLPLPEGFSLVSLPNWVRMVFQWLVMTSAGKLTLLEASSTMRFLLSLFLK